MACPISFLKQTFWNLNTSHWSSLASNYKISGFSKLSAQLQKKKKKKISALKNNPLDLKIMGIELFISAIAKTMSNKF